MSSATYEQAMRILKHVEGATLTNRQLQQLLYSKVFEDVMEATTKDGFCGLHRDTVRVALGLPKLTPDPDITELGELTVSDTVTLEEMAQAGEYRKCKTDIDIICSHFPITRRGSRKPYLGHYNSRLCTKDVTVSVAQMGDKELAKVEDLLSVGAHPRWRELQEEFLIVCLGSSIELWGSPHYPCLSYYGGSGERVLDLLPGLSGWFSFSRFLLVDKQAA